MKNGKRMVTLASILLVLALLPGPTGAGALEPQQVAFTYMEGFTWTITPEVLFEAMGGEEEDNVFVQEDDTATAVYYDVKEGGEPVQCYFLFEHDALVMVNVHYKTKPEDTLYTLRARLYAQFGEPTETEPGQSDNPNSIVKASEIDLNVLSAYNQWTPDDETQVYLMIFNKELYTIYYNVPRYTQMLINRSSE